MFMRYYSVFLCTFLLLVVAAMPLRPLNAATDEAAIPMISGGIGDDEFDELAAQKDQYNVKILFTDNTGAYLSDVAVTLMNAKGDEITKTVTEGPILLMKLKPGSYKIRATESGQAKERKLAVPAKGRAYLQVAFPALD